MSTKTLIPALKAKVGDWNYYICVMKYAQVAKEFSFAYELDSNPDLTELLQRGLGDRTEGIVEYLLKSEHRFLGSLIVAAWGGHPQYIPVEMDKTDDLVKGLDSGFGVLTFDGSQQYFALDGQHRLKAIKDVIKQKPHLGSEEISVILVSHFDTADGKERTRRLFTNINKNAKATSKQENIALDEDDGCAIINRRIINEHEFFKEKGRVSIYKKLTGGEMSLATSVKDSDKKAITSIQQLYAIVQHLSFETPIYGVNTAIRPPDDDLDESFIIITKRLDELLLACGNTVGLAKKQELNLLRKSKKGAEGEHAFLKGVIQKTVPKIVAALIADGGLTWEEALQRLQELDWHLSVAPWICVFVVIDDKRKMLTNRDFVGLLEDMLKVHLGPKSKQEIKKARKKFFELKGYQYPVAEKELYVNLKDSE